ncbi:MAG: MBL fold metallo-hydrolase [Candidatus Tectomicrobia bacterium]|nr:MBL fold metallo-hydrolase [Candidatus Tectomicrobia bacterium]
MNPFAPRTYGTLQRVTDRVYIFRNIVNSAVIVGDEAIAVVDTQVNEVLAERLLTSIRAVSDKPIRYAINTHYHWDHTGGNYVFKNAGAQVVSSAQTKAFIEERTPRQKAFLQSRGFELGPDPYTADLTVSEPHDLDLGNQRLHLEQLGSAETDDAMTVQAPQENCLLAGDTVMTGSFPIFGQPVMDEGLMGTTTWLDTIAHIERLQPDHVLPGHGPVAYQPELDLLKRIQRYFLDEVAVRVERQMPLPDLLDDLERQLPHWITALPVVWGTPRYAMLRVYRGLTRETAAEPGWQHYKPSAIPPGNATAVDAACASLVTLREFQAAASELEEGGDMGSAIDVARRATTALPDEPAAWVALAEGLIRGSRRVLSVLEKGDFFVEAVAAINHALELDPYHLGAHLSLGRFMIMRAYRNGDKPDDGMAHLRRVLESLASPARGPQAALAAQAHFYTGMGHRTNGDESQALVCFQTALASLPGFEPALLAQQA